MKKKVYSDIYGHPRVIGPCRDGMSDQGGTLCSFLAMLVALHLTPVSKWVIVSD